MLQPRGTTPLYLHLQKTPEQQRLASLYARRAALDLAIRCLEDYNRLRVKRLAAGLLKIA